MDREYANHLRTRQAIEDDQRWSDLHDSQAPERELSPEGVKRVQAGLAKLAQDPKWAAYFARRKAGKK